MGFQLGPKFLRRPPKDWLPAHAYAVRHAAYEHHTNDPDGGESVIETSAGLTVTWRVELDGREPYEFREERAGPTWLLKGPSGGGKRWYSVRIRPQYGLMGDVAVPCRVNPADPHDLWIDWDGAYAAHEPAWERQARVQREKARRAGAFEHAVDRIFNPFAGKLRTGEEVHVEEAIAAEAALAAKWRPEPVDQTESTELNRRIRELGRIKETGRRATATVVAREETTRTLSSVPIVDLTFEIDDGGETRRVDFEHAFGPRHAKRYRVGRRVDVWIDPEDPGAICPGE